MSAFVFWMSLSLLLFTFVGYPVLLSTLAGLFRKDVRREAITPFVSIIIAAYNEERGIEEKIQETLRLDYPRDRYEIIVASDASTDGTNEIAHRYQSSGVSLVNARERRGKTSVQNEAVQVAKGEILVFSDATTGFAKDILLKIVRNFADTSVGAVGGELEYVNREGGGMGQGNGLYWKFEKFLKSRESAISSLIGVSGCCYALRRELYEPMDPGLISDFVVAQLIYKKGKRVVYEPEAHSYEETNTSVGSEFRMRVRVAIRTLNGLWNMRSLLNPLAYRFYALQLIFHKVFRYLVPVFLLSMAGSNIFVVLSAPCLLYLVPLAGQCAFYAAAALGAASVRGRVCAIAYYFCMTHAALLLGMIRFLAGERQVVWVPQRSP